MTARLVRIGVLAIVAFAAGLVLARWLLPSPRVAPATEIATVLDTAKPLPVLALTGPGGRHYGPGLFQGHWSLVFFGFTQCPDVCPTALALLAQTVRQLGDLPAARRPQVVFVTIDPERDDPQRVGDYVQFFDPAFLGATGTAQQIAAAARAFAVPYAKVPLPGGGYTMDHGAAIYIVGPAGAIAAVASGARDPAALARDFRKVVDYVEQDR